MGILCNILRSIFREVVEKKIADPQGRLARLIKLTTGDLRELVKPFILDNPKYGYENAIKLLESQYGKPLNLEMHLNLGIVYRNT